MTFAPLAVAKTLFISTKTKNAIPELTRITFSLCLVLSINNFLSIDKTHTIHATRIQ